MAGGKGVRLRPLTNNLPKPMVKIAGKPILERIIHRFTEQGINKFYISVNYLGNIIEDYFGDGEKFDCEIRYIKEKKFLHTGGSLSLLKEKFSDSLIVMNGDLVTGLDFNHLLDFHKKGKFSATMGVKFFFLEIPFGVIQTRRNRLKDLVEKPVHRYLVNAGIYVLNPEVIRLIPQNKVFPMTDLFKKLLAKKTKVGVYDMKEEWVDVGRLDELKKAEEEILRPKNLEKF